MGIRTVDLDLFHHRKTDPVILLAKAGDIGVAARILGAELVAGKPDEHHTARRVVLVQFFKPGKLRREAAGAGGIDDQHDLALQSGEVKRRAVDACGGEIRNRGHGVPPY